MAAAAADEAKLESFLQWLQVAPSPFPSLLQLLCSQNPKFLNPDPLHPQANGADLRGCTIRACGAGKGFGVFCTAAPEPSATDGNIPFPSSPLIRALTCARLRRCRGGFGGAARPRHHADAGAAGPARRPAVPRALRGGGRRRPPPRHALPHGRAAAPWLALEAVRPQFASPRTFASDLSEPWFKCWVTASVGIWICFQPPSGAPFGSARRSLPNWKGRLCTVLR